MQSSISDLEEISENVFRNKGSFFIFDDFMRDFLIKKAQKSPYKRSRICLHKNNDEKTQNMIICLLKNQKFSKHKHPINKNESYTVIFGDLYVDIYNKKNCFENTIKLNKFNTPYMHQGGCIHQPYTRDSITIYHEIFHGDFDRKVDMIEYS